MQLQNFQSSQKLNQNFIIEERFELKRHLTDTLQGRIYLAIDKTNGSHVIVKETWKQLVLLRKSREGHRVAEDFMKEKCIMKHLTSQEDRDPGFVRILGEWEDNNCYYYAMEHCPHGDLFEFVKNMHTKQYMLQYAMKQQKFPQVPLKESNQWIQTVRHIFRQLVNCVNWMHEKKVCHLDLSLENTMIFDATKQHVKIIDFGLAFTSNDFAYDKRVGKTGYMAPEVFEKKKYDARKADIWSLGVMLFMMLVGAPPYELPTSTNPSFHFIINGRLRDVLQHWKRLRHVTEDALDLMTKIFKIENERISIKEIMKHPFVQLDSDSSRSIKPKVQVETNKCLHDQVEEIMEDHINDNISIDNHSNSEQDSSSRATTTNVDIPANSRTNVVVTAPCVNGDIVIQLHGNNNQTGEGHIQGCTHTAFSLDDNKNNSTTNPTNPNGDFKINDISEIRNRKFKSIEANDFRRKILEIDDKTNSDSWHNFVRQIEAIMEDKTHKKKQILNRCRPGGETEFHSKGLIDEEESQVNNEIEELKWLHKYVVTKAN